MVCKGVSVPSECIHKLTTLRSRVLSSINNDIGQKGPLPKNIEDLSQFITIKHDLFVECVCVCVWLH